MYDLVSIIKKLPERTDAEYSLNVEDVEKIYLGFLSSIKNLEYMISKK